MGMSHARPTIFAVVLLALTAGCADSTEPEPPPPDEGAQVDLAPGAVSPTYGSTYGSNCFCLLCTAYCSTKDGTT
jgi:hypothetical protein